MPIWFDYRERALIKLAPTVKELTPPVGDIWIGDLSGANLMAGGVILERKTGADLEASIMDGRYREQRGRLLAYAAEHKVAVGYVIEGILDRLDGRLTESALLKHITRLQFHHRIPVVQTASSKETVRLAELIEEQWVKDCGKFAWPCLSASGSSDTAGTNGTTAVAASYIKSACRDTPETFLLGTLTQCRGISETMGRFIIAKYPSLQSLMAAQAADLALLGDPQNPTKKRLGKAVAERLYGLLHPSGSHLPKLVQDI
jgi:ERCC4-type nuclease